jgi:transposase
MTHPAWALKHKAKGTELRCIRGKYYLYQVSSFWDKKKKCTRKVTGKMVGRITKDDGLIPRGTKRPSKMQTMLQNITTKEYGATAALQQVSADIINHLKEAFPKRWEELLALAINRLLHQAPLKNMEFFYKESFLSEQFPSLKLSKNTLTNLMQELGNNNENIANFLRKFVDGSEHLVFDTTHIISQSKGAGINQYGYNSQQVYDPQVNLFYMFSTDKQLPVYYRIFPGNIHGISALKHCVVESGTKNAIMIGDKGFCSEKNMELLQDAGLQYILPLKRDSALINYNRLKSRSYEQAFDKHFFYNNRVIFYYELSPGSNQKVVVFCDQGLRLDEETSYLRRVEQQYDGYSMDGYKEKQLSFGTIAMVTNMVTHSAQEIYENYKTRMEVESVFDTYKNLLQADRTYMHSDESIHAWIFINHLAILMYYKLFNLIKKHNLLTTISPKDLLIRLSMVTKLKINNQWYLSEINGKSQKMFNKLGLHVT